MKSLRYLIPAALVVLVLVQVASAMHLFGWNNPAAPPPYASAPIRIGGPFALEAPDGRVVTDRDFDGKWRVVYFGYTNCPDSCPTALNDLANALDMLGAEAARVASIFITIDPARDTPAIMGSYTRKFDPRILGLTGTPAQIHQVEAEYHVFASGTPQETGGRLLFDHSSVFVIQNPDGRFVEAIDGATNPDVVAARLRRLIH